MKRNLILIVVLCIVLIAFGWAMSVLMRDFTRQALAPRCAFVNAFFISHTYSQYSYSKITLSNPTPTIIPDPVTIINDVRALARLETIQYSVEKIITAESKQDVFGPLFGDKLLFVAHGVVIAGIDLNQLQAEDMDMRDGVLTVDLPEAEVFIATLDNDKSYVYDRQPGLLTKGESDLETLARQAAETEIREAAIEDGILEQAKLNAEVFLDRLFNSLGFDSVIFE